MRNFFRNLFGKSKTPEHTFEKTHPLNTIEICIKDEDGFTHWEEIPFDDEVKVGTDGMVYFKINRKWIAQPQIVGIAY